MMRRAALISLLCVGCEADTEPVESGPTEVTFRIAHVPLDAGGTLVNDLGYSIALDRWVAVSASLEIRPCEQSAFLLWQAVGGVAAAHVTPTETRAGGTAQPRDLLGAGDAAVFGRLTPPPGDYCQVRYASSPADGDMEGSGGGVALLGKSMVVSGRYTPPGGGSPVPFDFETSIGTRVDFPEIAANAAAPLFRVSGGLPVEVTVTLHPDRLFDGVDFALMGPAQVESQLLFNLSAATEFAISTGEAGSGD